MSFTGTSRYYSRARRGSDDVLHAEPKPAGVKIPTEIRVTLDVDAVVNRTACFSLANFAAPYSLAT